jgi:hypothetical protein
MRRQRRPYANGGPIDPFYPFPTVAPEKPKYNRAMDLYDAPVLPLATITAKKSPLKGTLAPTKKESFLEEWGRIINEENKDAGLASAMFMTPINAAMSLPQLLATKLITGETQRPSKALGIKNPVGKFATDMVLDPLNFTGVPIKAARGVANLLEAPNIGRAIIKTAKDVGTKLINSNLNPKNLKTASAEKWINDWYTDPDILARLPEPTKGPFSANQASILKGLAEYKPKNYINLLKDRGLKKYVDLSLSSSGVSYGTPKSIYVNNTSFFPFNKKGFESTRVHELSHLTDMNGFKLRTIDEDLLVKPLGFKSGLENSIKRSSGEMGKWEKYYTDPTEIRARLMQARFKLNLRPGDEFTSGMFDKIAKEDNWFDMGKYIKDKKSFVEMANKMWAAPAVVAGGAALNNEKS